jgi:hypothetical protein
MADEHGGVAVVVVNPGGAAVPLDTDGDLVAADVDDTACVHDDVGAARGAGQGDAEIDRRRGRCPGLDGCSPADGAVGSVMVVVVDEGVELALQRGEITGEAL